MNSPTLPPARPAFLAATLLAGLASCAMPPKPAAPAPTAESHLSNEEALQQLRTGKASLDCTTPPCATAWTTSRPDLAAHYSNNEWRQLASQTIQLNYHQDLGYFYLGRAAEGLGARNAALQYYKTAQSLATGPDDSARCASTPDGCSGLSLLTEVLTRSQIVEAQRARSYALRHQAHAAPKPGQPEDTTEQPPGDNWVDPPPASQ